MADISISHDDLSPVDISIDYSYTPTQSRYTVSLFGEEVFESEWEDRGYGWDPDDVVAEWKAKWQKFQVEQFKHWCGYDSCREG